MTPPDSRARAVPAPQRASSGPADDLEDADPGLARERTVLAWTRTAIAFAAVGGALLKTTPLAGLLVLAMSALVWGLGRVSSHPARAGQPHWPRHLLITLTVTLVSLVALAVILLAGGGLLRLGM
jgi:uncharacterized membrane protein YidH (DUF202 family)